MEKPDDRRNGSEDGVEETGDSGNSTGTNADRGVGVVDRDAGVSPSMMDAIQTAAQAARDESIINQSSSSSESTSDTPSGWVQYTQSNVKAWQNIQTGEIRFVESPPGDVYGGSGDGQTGEHGPYRTLVPGDEVMVLPADDKPDTVYRKAGETHTPNEEPYQGTFKEVRADPIAQSQWANVEVDGETVAVDTEQVIVLDGVMPERGEEIDFEDLSYGDTIVRQYGSDEQEGIVTRFDDDDDGTATATVYVPEMGRTIQINRFDRFTRADTADMIADPEALVETIEWRNFGYEKQDIKEELVELASSENGAVWRDAIREIDVIRPPDDDNKAAWKPENENGESELQLKAGVKRDVIMHEMTHAMVEGGYGYTYDDSRSVFAKFYVQQLPPYEFGRNAHDVVVDALAAQFEDEMDESTAESNRTDPDELAQQLADGLDAIDEDEELTKDDFLLKQRGTEQEVPDEVEQFIEAVNKTWVDVWETYESEGEQAAEQVMPYRPYAVTNAHETAAAIAQLMHSDDGDEAHLANIMDNHPHLIDAYLELAEPSDSAKEVMRRHAEHTDTELDFDSGDYQW